jgi:hypothetical protein
VSPGCSEHPGRRVYCKRNRRCSTAAVAGKEVTEYLNVGRSECLNVGRVGG